MKSATVPYNYGSGAIIAFRNFAFEVGVVQRMIFNVHRQPLVGVALGGSLGHGPGLQRPIDRQPELLEQPPGPLLLNYARAATPGPRQDFPLRQIRPSQASAAACGAELCAPR